MAKTKDGFYKQTGSLTGSDNLILLAGGGTTTLSYYTPFTVYSYSNGCLVKTDIPTESNTMVTFRIEGNSYGNNSILTTGNFYNYKDNNLILHATAYHHGYNFGKITVFCYNNYVHLWFKLPSNYLSFVVTVYATNGTPNNTNRITSISNQAIPTSGVTRSVEITPVVDSVTGDGSYLTVKIGNVSKTLTIPSSLKNPNAFNVFGVSYDGSADKTVDMSTLIGVLGTGDSPITDSTHLLTSHVSGFTSSGNTTTIYKRTANHLWSYIKGKTDGLYVTALGTSGNYVTWTKNGTTNNLTVPYATLAATVTCSASTSNTDRPIVLTNTSNGLYYTTKATINYSTGNVKATSFQGKLITVNTAGSWVSGMTNAAIMYDNYTALNSSSYHPILGVKTNGENVVNFGAYVNSVGFYGYKKGRTENSYDWSFVFNSETGDVSTSKTITAGKFIGNLNNTLTFSAGAFSAKTYNNSAAVTVNIPTHTSHLTNNSGFLTSLPSHTHSYLPLTGGTISNTSYGPLIIERKDSANMAAIKFKNSSGDLGSIGMNTVNGNLLIYNATTSAYRTILDSGNYTTWINTTNFPGLNKTGTVTQVKVGSTAYNPSNGVVSLPAYPTSLPANGGTATNAKYLLTLNKDNTTFYSDTLEAYLKWESADTAAFKFNDGTYKFRADIANVAGSVDWDNVTNKPTIPTVTNYYWANVKVSSTSNTATKPTFGETNISGGLLKITNSSNTTTIGSQNVSFCHIYNSASIPFILNNSLLTTSGNLGNTTYRWEDLYLKKLIDINYSTGSADIGTKVTGSTYSIGFIIGSGNTNRGIYDYTNSRWMLYSDATTTYIPKWASLGSTYSPVYFNSTGKPTAATSYAKAIKTITRSGTTFTYTCIDGTTGTFTQQDNNSTYNVFGKTINADFKTAYRTLTKGNTSQGYYISAIRNDTSSVADSPIYGTGLAFGMADTHGYLYLNYNAVEAYLGGGNADKLNWVKKLAFADGTGASGTWAISVSGNAATSSRLKILDLRDTNHLPNSSNYPARYVTGWFNSTGTPTSAWYSGLTIKGWDNTYQTWLIASGSSTSINEKLYYRCGITNSSGTATWNAWKQIAFVTDISNYYWANVKISSASSTTTTPTFGASVRLNSSITGAGGTVALELFRGTNASWKMDNNAGWLRFLCNYTTTVVDYYTVFSLEYNTKKATFQGDVTAPNFIGVASKVTCTEGSGNYDRAIVVTNTTNLIFYTNKFKINYSTGKVTATGSIHAASFYESSDRNLKENIQVLSNDLLDKVYNVKEVSFNWKKTKSQAFGYIALDFETISETFIGRNDDGTLSLNYTEVLVAQIAALKQKIANLEKRIQVLDSKN